MSESIQLSLFADLFDLAPGPQLPPKRQKISCAAPQPPPSFPQPTLLDALVPLPEPEKHGPYATTRLVWVDGKPQWTPLQLTPEGREFFDSSLAQFGGHPERLLSKTHPKLYKKAMQHLGPEAVHQASLCGWLRFVQCYDPARKLAISTYAKQWVSWYVQMDLDGKKKKTNMADYALTERDIYARMSRPTNASDDTQTWSDVSDRTTDPTLLSVDQREKQRAVHRALAILPAKYRSVMHSLWIDGKTVRQVAKIHEISVESVERIEKYSLPVMREELEVFEPEME